MSHDSFSGCYVLLVDRLLFCHLSCMLWLDSHADEEQCVLQGLLLADPPTSRFPFFLILA